MIISMVYYTVNSLFKIMKNDLYKFGLLFYFTHCYENLFSSITISFISFTVNLVFSQSKNVLIHCILFYLNKGFQIQPCSAPFQGQLG